MPDKVGAILIVEKGIESESVIPLGEDSIVLGKKPYADVVIESPFVSRRHAEITFVDGGYWISDLGSKNGTIVNHSSIGTGRYLLKNGDRVELGPEVVVLRFQDAATTTTATFRPGQTISYETLVVDPASRDVWVAGAAHSCGTEAGIGIEALKVN